MSLSAMLGFPRQKKQRKQVLILGLDASGKSTLLYRMTLGAALLTVPTCCTATEKLIIGKQKYKFTEVGGLPRLRFAWRAMLGTAEALVYLIDVADIERIPLSIALLAHNLRKNGRGESIIMPVLICLNSKSSHDKPKHSQIIEDILTQIKAVVEIIGESMTFDIFEISATDRVDSDRVIRWVSATV